jgi:sucrose-6-phosphate hydrolase SacC (GH32 family)
LAWSPVKELAALRTKTTSRGPGALTAGEKPLTAPCGELVEIECAFEPEGTATLELIVRGVKIAYDTQQQQIIVTEQRAAAPLRDGKQRIRIYVDRVGLEVFASDGIAYVPMPIKPVAGAREVSVAANGGKVKVTQFDVHDLKSIWP